MIFGRKKHELIVNIEKVESELSLGFQVVKQSMNRNIENLKYLSKENSGIINVRDQLNYNIMQATAINTLITIINSQVALLEEAKKEFVESSNKIQGRRQP